MRPMPRLPLLALALGLGCALPSAAVNAAPPGAETTLGEALAIVTRSGTHVFNVEVMRDDASRARGLMFRRSMAPDQGMLFDFERVQPVAMWMKNTYLPLDMLFIRQDGTIARIAADAEPLSTQVIPSNEPVLSVLELNAGTAARLGIRPGDRIDHPLFRTR
ncbi:MULTISPECIES: DUF192 domain-containing protein [Methylobacterium]